MKHLLSIAAALFLAAPTTVLAAPNDKPAHHRPHKPGNGSGPNNPGNGNGPNKPGNGNGPNKPGDGNYHKPGGGSGKPPARPGHKPSHRPGWNKPGRPGHGWYWGGKRRSSIRINLFVYPRGYSYRLWHAGDRLPPVFLAPTYYYADYAALGLNPPPPGYQWVRYGNDVLLVNITTGGIVEVISDVFYQ